MNPAAPILLFDSGVGGLTVLAELRKLLPHAPVIYFADTAGLPYGEKTEAEIAARVAGLLGRLSERYSPRLITIACNTASTIALPRIRSHFGKPVVGVVPAIKPAAKLTQSGVIGLLATPATVARPYTLGLIADFASHCTVHRLGSARLVQIAEDKLRGQTPNTAEIRDIISPLFADPALDTLVLACTHFPLLRAELEAAAPRPVQWVDSGEAIARRVLDLLPVANDPAHRLPDPAGFDCWLTADGADLAELEAGLARLGATGLRVLDG